MDEIDVQLKLRKLTKKRDWKEGFSFLESVPGNLQSAGLSFLTKTMQQRGDIKKAVKMTTQSKLTYNMEDINHLLVFIYHHGMTKEYKLLTEKIDTKDQDSLLKGICENFGDGDIEHAVKKFL